MTDFPLVVDAATASIAIDQAGRAHRSIDIVFGDESDPSGVLAVHVTDITEGFFLLRAGIRATDKAAEALGAEWASGGHAGDALAGNPAVVIRSNGEIVLTYVAIDPEI